DVAGLTGTHLGCDTSNCGACTVELDGPRVKSRPVFAVQADGAQVTTIEGLANGSTLHPLQKAFWDEHGLQCGFCTPGMIMAAKQLLERNPNPTEQEIRLGLEGNLCRCTGYHNIVKSIQAASKVMAAGAGAKAAAHASLGGGNQSPCLDLPVPPSSAARILPWLPGPGPSSTIFRRPPSSTWRSCD